MSDIQHVMASAPGVNVEQVETNRTYYTSRGFDITNFQTDGSGMPLTFGNQQVISTPLSMIISTLRKGPMPC